MIDKEYVRHKSKTFVSIIMLLHVLPPGSDGGDQEKADEDICERQVCHF